MNLRENIKRVLKEESNKDFTPVIKMLLEEFVDDHKDILCKVEVKHPDKRTKLPHSDNNYENYRVTFYLIGGYGSSNWPVTQGVRRVYDELMNDITQGQRTIIKLWSDHLINFINQTL